MTLGQLNLLTVIAAILTALVIGINAQGVGRFIGLLDYPDPSGGRKRHQRVTPLVGGLAVIVAFELAAVALLTLLDQDSAYFDWQVGWIAFAAGVMSLVGLADDRFSLSPNIRLAVAFSVLMITIVEAPDFRIEFLRFSGVDELMILPMWASIAFTLLCLIGLLNAVNMADGKDGLVITLSLIWTGVLFVRNPASFDPMLFAVAGSLVVLLLFNLRGKLFLGDGGSYGISAIFGLLVIYAYNHSFAAFGAEQVAIMFLIPVLDTVRLMTWRVRHGRSPFAGDRNHLHHYIAARWGWPEGLVIYGGIVALPNILAVLFPDLSLVWLALCFALYAGTLKLSAQRGTFVAGFSG